MTYIFHKNKFLFARASKMAHVPVVLTYRIYIYIYKEILFTLQVS